MSEDSDLRTPFLNAIAARDGIVVVGGRSMVKTEIARSVLRDYVAALYWRLHDVVANDATAEKKWLDELNASTRRIEKRITELWPVLN